MDTQCIGAVRGIGTDVPGALWQRRCMDRRCPIRLGLAPAMCCTRVAGRCSASQTAAGKDERAINASGPVFRGEVKFSRHAYDKTVTFKDTTRNHMVSQVVGFRIGDKDAAKRADDLLDTLTYAVAITLGNSEGFA